MRTRLPSERDSLELFRAVRRDMAPRDAQDLMSYPFFSLAKSRRTRPIDFQAGGIAIRVDADNAYGMATIWDADVLIWAASQIVEARDAGLRTSPVDGDHALRNPDLHRPGYLGARLPASEGGV